MLGSKLEQTNIANTFVSPSRWIKYSSISTTFQSGNQDDNTYVGKYAEELFSEKVSAGKRMYFIDLKREGGKDGKLFVKLSEVNKETRRRTNIMIDFELIHQFVQNLKDGQNKTSNIEPYASIKSELFKHKIYDILLTENAYGQIIEIKERYTPAYRQEAGGVRVLINLTDIPKLVNALQIVIADGQARACQ